MGKGSVSEIGQGSTSTFTPIGESDFPPANRSKKKTSKTPKVRTLDSTASTSCCQRTRESKWTILALVATALTLLVLAILASTGAFNHAMGTVNAAYFSYGMYGACAAFLLAAIVLKRCS